MNLALNCMQHIFLKLNMGRGKLQKGIKLDYIINMNIIYNSSFSFGNILLDLGKGFSPGLGHNKVHKEQSNKHDATVNPCDSAEVDLCLNLEVRRLEYDVAELFEIKY